MTLPLFGYVSLGVDVCYCADNHLCIHYLCSSQQHYVAFPVWILSPHLFLSLVCFPMSQELHEDDVLIQSTFCFLL